MILEGRQIMLSAAVIQNMVPSNDSIVFILSLQDYIKEDSLHFYNITYYSREKK